MAQEIQEPKSQVQGTKDEATATRSQLTQKMERIAELERRADIIQSLELHIDIYSVSSVSTIEPQGLTSVGLQSVIALFSADGTRFRFVADFTFSEQQTAPTIKRVSFVYKPETPEQVPRRLTCLSLTRLTFVKEGTFRIHATGAPWQGSQRLRIRCNHAFLQLLTWYEIRTVLAIRVN